jgi:GDP/UDP-N,N'-diacetylbacillosamine 2-epimerase (hydrolysing)
MIGLLTTGRHDLAYLTPIKEAMRDETIWVDVTPSGQADSHMAAAWFSKTAMGEFCFQFEKSPITRLVVLGDRTETLAACLAATCMRIPIAHIHGGDVTLGAIDNVCRNAISQLADMHFAATNEAYRNLLLMRVPGAVHMTGSPAIDLLLRKKRERVPGKDVLLGFHPETLSDVDPVEQAKSALYIARWNMPDDGRIIFLGANPDAGGQQINAYMKDQHDVETVTGLDCESYWDLLATCHCLVGNTSSGVIEAPALGVPFIEVGDRQKGRYRGSYGDGHATERIVAVLRASLSSASSPRQAP